MTPIPKPPNPTVDAINRHYAESRDSYEGRTISISTLAAPCERQLFYNFRWASPQEALTGQQIRLFQTGNNYEARFIEDLRAIGCEVTDFDDSGRQITVTACGKHVRGKLDAEILGLPEAPATVHVGEFKTHNAKSFAALKKLGVRKAKAEHFGQLQTYMHLRGRDRGLYLAVCKDTDELYAERVKIDLPYVLRLLARAQRIIDADAPPSKLHEDPTAKMAFECGWCRHFPVCHEHQPVRVTCRSCLFSSPEDGGGWSCARFNKPLSAVEQMEACPAHLHLPGLVAGRQVDASEADETVDYEMWDGTLWTDGVGVPMPVPTVKGEA